MHSLDAAINYVTKLIKIEEKYALQKIFIDVIVISQ